MATKKKKVVENTEPLSLSNVNEKEPAVLYGAIATILVALAAAFDVGIEPDVLEGIILAAIPLIVGVITRSQVYAPANVQE